MCGLFGDDSPPSAPQHSAPPPPHEIMDVIDEISGVQSLTVTGPDGKKRRVIQRLPKTPQEQARDQQGEELMNRSIKNIMDLRQYDPYAVVDFSPIIQTFANLNQEQIDDLKQVANFGNIQQDVDEFKKMQSSLLEQEFERQNRITENELAGRGISNSTTGNERRALMATNQGLARQQANVNALQYGEDLATQRLGRNLTAYQARQEGRSNRLNAAQTEYGLKQQQLQDLSNRRQNAISENMGVFQLGAGIAGQDLAKALGSRAPELANQTFAMQNADQLARYNADINRQNMNYQNQLNAYNARPPSFGEFVGGSLMSGAGQMFTAPKGSLANKFGNKIANYF